MKLSSTNPLPGLNIQQPWAALMLSGKKTVETRFYPIPDKYLDVPLAIIETPGKTGNFKSRIVGAVIFSDCYQYKSEQDFRKDAKRHLISNGDQFDWTSDKRKWAWVIREVKALKNPVPAPSKRGIIWTSKIELKQLSF